MVANGTYEVTKLLAEWREGMSEVEQLDLCCEI